MGLYERPNVHRAGAALHSWLAPAYTFILRDYTDGFNFR